MKTAGWIILGLAVIVGVIAFFRQEKLPNELILFVGNGCPHCAIVEEYLQTNNVAQKLNFTSSTIREVFQNADNNNLLTKIAAACGIAREQMGVPLLWDGQNCYFGDQDIINYFSQKIQ